NGASLGVTESAGGEMKSAATENTNRMAIIAMSGVPPAPLADHGMKSRNAAPMMMAPRPNFTGADGARVPSLVHIAANTPESTMMKIGLIEFTHEIGITHPKMLRLSC